MRLALDAMGGDHAPAAAVEGACLFAKAFPRHDVLLVGLEARVRAYLPKKHPTNLFLHACSEVVEMEEQASASIRKKRDSSLRVCFELMRRREVVAMVSAGHSGAVMTGALLVLGRIAGVERPAFAAVMPALKGGGKCLLLDAGANVQCRPFHLAQFALMGEAFARKLLGVTRPKVAVLSNGEETSKGTVLTQEAASLLKKSDLRFVGYVEGKDIFTGDVEVVVTDGFTGNVVLKTSEGAAMGVTSLIRSAVERAGISEKLGAFLLKPTLAALTKVVDYAEIGGAPLLGINGAVVVAHGRSTPRAIQTALTVAAQTAKAQLQEDIALRIRSSASWMPETKRRRTKPEITQAVSET